MTTVYCHCPSYDDATSFYRGMGPLTRLATMHKDITVVPMPAKPDWPVMKASHICFLQRPWTLEHLKTAEMASDMSVPLWVDYDDFLFQVPASNPAYGQFSDPKAQYNMTECLRLADVVTVSTPHLKKMLSGYANDIRVIPNAWPSSIFRRPSKRRAKTEWDRPVMWRGSPTHTQDLYEVAGPIQDMIATGRNHWVFVGNQPWFFFAKGDNCAPNLTYVPPVSLIPYFHFLKTAAPSTLIVPLHESDFNLCKSNIAWMEGAWAGAITVAPAWPEWERPGVINYGGDTGITFQQAVECVLDLDVDKHQRIVNEAREMISKELDEDRVNIARTQVIAALLQL